MNEAWKKHDWGFRRGVPFDRLSVFDRTAFPASSVACGTLGGFGKGRYQEDVWL